MGFILWVEATPLSIWIRGSPSLWAFPFILYLHTLGLALLVGLGTAQAIWILKFAARYPIAPIREYLPVMWVGFGINALSGVLLLVAYPAKALTNPIFYIKLVAIFAAVAILAWLDRAILACANPKEVFKPNPAIQRAAFASLVFWAVGILTGRFLAYTHRMLMAADGF